MYPDAPLGQVVSKIFVAHFHPLLNGFRFDPGSNEQILQMGLSILLLACSEQGPTSDFDRCWSSLVNLRFCWLNVPHFSSYILCICFVHCDSIWSSLVGVVCRNAETVLSLPTSDTDTASSMSLKKPNSASSVSDFDPEKDQFFKWFYNWAGLAQSEQYGHGWSVFLCNVFVFNARRCLKEISSISGKNLMVTARLLGNSGDISNVSPSWCFRIPTLKFSDISRNFRNAKVAEITHLHPETVFQAQKALRRRLEELKKGGDALGMRQLPGNHREAKVSCIFLLQHELVPTLVWEYSIWIGNEWRCRRTACIRDVRWGSWIGLFIPHALGKKNDIIQFTHSFISRFRIDLDLLQVVNLSLCWQFASTTHDHLHVHLAYSMYTYDEYNHLTIKVEAVWQERHVVRGQCVSREVESWTWEMPEDEGTNEG